MSQVKTVEISRPELNHALMDMVSKPIVQSLLYDSDLLPEQLESQKEFTVGILSAYSRLEGVLLAFKYLEVQGVSFEREDSNGD